MAFDADAMVFDPNGYTNGYTRSKHFCRIDLLGELMQQSVATHAWQRRWTTICPRCPSV
jgi:hypothetical protein